MQGVQEHSLHLTDFRERISPSCGVAEIIHSGRLDSSDFPAIRNEHRPSSCKLGISIRFTLRYLSTIDTARYRVSHFRQNSETTSIIQSINLALITGVTSRQFMKTGRFGIYSASFISELRYIQLALLEAVETNCSQLWVVERWNLYSLIAR